MRKEEIEELIRLVESSQINELEVCEGRKKIRISKGGPAAAAFVRPRTRRHRRPRRGTTRRKTLPTARMARRSWHQT